MIHNKEYELFESTSEMGIRGFGITIEEAFENGAKAMFSIMVDLDTVEERVKKKVRVDDYDYESLFCDWLNELLVLRDTENLIFSDFKVEGIRGEEGNISLRGWASGEPVDLAKHSVKTEVKAATYFQVEVGEKNGLYHAQCIVDV